MTMKYVHIGIGDQARAVAQLPTPKTESEAAAVAAPLTGAALHGRCISGVVECPGVTLDGTSNRNAKRLTPCDGRELGVSCRHLSPDDNLEAAGIEPASCDFAATASTCVGC